MRILDLFCGAGGASQGLYEAGFEVCGVDINPQPNYPFQFVQADALTFPLLGFDAYWASPPCQRYSRMQRVQNNEHPDLVAPVRTRLRATGKPYTIENVVGAPLIKPTVLCGVMFGMRIYRHRLFETSFTVAQPAHPRHVHRAEKAGRTPRNGDFYSVAGHFPGVGEVRKIMGVPWMTRDEIAECIPPAFSRYVGQELIKCCS